MGGQWVTATVTADSDSGQRSEDRGRWAVSVIGRWITICYQPTRGNTKKSENLSGLTRQETLRNRTEKTSVRRGYVFRDICEMRVSKYEVRIVPKRKRELGLLVNMSKQGAVLRVSPRLTPFLQLKQKRGSWKLKNG